MLNKKFFFPKIKKKIKGFLTDESGKITKKDALGLATGVMLLSGINEVNAGAHNAGAGGGHFSGDNFNYDPGKISISASLGTGDVSGHGSCSAVNTSHSSGIINGHFSDNGGSVSGGTHSNTLAHSQGAASITGHGSHSSHSNVSCGCGGCG